MIPEEVNLRLDREYGPLLCKQSKDAVSVLVETILSQNTSDTNSGRAFKSLLEIFGDWESVASADVGSIANSIKRGGLANIKAERIKVVLQWIQQERGSFNIDFLRELSVVEARLWLMRLPGVGPKTASCVLLFALGMPALPVDTHVFRVSWRLGLIARRSSTEEAHALLERLIPEHQVYSFHMHMVQHGRRVCRARNPLCQHCVLEDICPSSALKQDVEGQSPGVGEAVCMHKTRSNSYTAWGNVERAT
ncbi:MAG: endonuclease III [Chloroflexota bacterium]|nr:endonuclease III [Chloroflexota bacterium]